MIKIFILYAGQRFQPGMQPFRYPRHNRDFGVEQDFYEYLLDNRALLTDDPAAADWHYLPVYWTRWHLNHNYAKTGLDELQKEVERVMLDDKKTFTICQYDDGPVVDVGKTVQFLASRKTALGIDIPLLSSSHRRPIFAPKKRFLASFIGMKTHPVRGEMERVLGGRDDVFFLFGNKGSRFFVKTTLASNVTLAPRGYGGSSFRLFEAMQLGVVPFLVGDLDTRPFRKFIDWERFSFYSSRPTEIIETIKTKTPNELVEMGRQAKIIYENELRYQRWCKYVIKELESYV